MATYVPPLAVGPFLRYQNWDVNTQAWTGSVLVVSAGPQPPQLTLRHAGHSFAPQPVCLDSFQGYNFWRWQLDLQLLAEQSQVEYCVTAAWSQGPPTEKRVAFYLPGVDASWELAATALWKDVLGVHRQQPLHCLVGGGDQLYQDGFFREPELVAWLSIKDRKIRESMPVSPAMDMQLSHFVLHHYLNWFSKENIRDAFACIPQVMTWDDHDILDGYGSYPEQLQNCPVFQHAFRVARRFYLFFQQHTQLPQAHAQANLFGAGESFSLIRMMGRNVALVAPDVRSERTRKQVVTPASWQMVFDRIAALPSSVRHLVVCLTIPIVYPKIPLTEKAMGLMSNLGRDGMIDTLLSKTGVWGLVKGKVVSGFQEPELLDDLLDHWTSDFHLKEREMLIRRLQGVAQARNLRVSCISGDVHVGGLGRLYSHPKLDLRRDFRFMPQVISSAIMNAPPPAGVVSMLHTCSNAHNSGVDRFTKEKMVRLFKADYPETDKLIPLRNWATLRELPAGAPAPALAGAHPQEPPLQPGDLLVTLRVEPDHKQPHLPVKQYPIPIPTLEPAGGTYGAPLASPGQYAPQQSAYGPPIASPTGVSYGQPQYGQPQYGQAPYGQPQYGAPTQSGAHAAAPAAAPAQYAGGYTGYPLPASGGYAPGPQPSQTAQPGGYAAAPGQPQLSQQFGGMSLGGAPQAGGAPGQWQGAPQPQQPQQYPPHY